MTQKSSIHEPFVCHCLMGPPGAGKATFAQQWVKKWPEHVWVSTDRIRETLYGDASIQGVWAEIEAVVLAQIADAIAHHQPVIYDATNAKRAWRLMLMQKLAAKNLANQERLWMGWWLASPLAECKRRNRQRKRRVEDGVIEDMHRSLKEMPPLPAEGFAAVNKVPLQKGAVKKGAVKKGSAQKKERPFDWEIIARKTHRLPQTLMQRQRRHGQCQQHPYSSLLAFERLLHLLALLLAFPGAGSLHLSDVETLKAALGTETLPLFTNAVEEMAALLRVRCGEIYADEIAIAQNLVWLKENHMLNSPYCAEPIALDSGDFAAEEAAEETNTLVLHRYSDKDVFRRLMSTVRFILHHPFLYEPGKGSLKTLVTTMEHQRVIAPGYMDSVRRDIGEVLKPYGLIPNAPQTQGYFAGTGILAVSELLQVFEGLSGQVHQLEDPRLLMTYERLRDRLCFLHSGFHSDPHLDSCSAALGVQAAAVQRLTVQPVRRILQQPIVDVQSLPAHTLSLAAPGNAERLDGAIRRGQVLTLKRRRGTGRFGGESEVTFEVLPLQIVFYNIAWYLGYQQRGEKQGEAQPGEDGLLRFERLDRLALIGVGEKTLLTAAERAQALRRLMQLQRASYGLYLGESVVAQRAFLRGQKEPVAVLCELWFSDRVFRFVSEGSQRFGGQQQMSPRLDGAAMTRAEKETIFCLSKTGDAQFPNRMQVRVPVWVVDGDVDFRRWILGFGGQVKVIAPESLQERIKAIGADIVTVYV